MDLFDSIIKANSESSNVSGLQYGIVASIKDPLSLQRVQVYDQAKGGKYKSDWLIRGLPFTSFSPPLPAVGDLVIFGYINNDPHHGCYLGVAVNNNNKPVGPDSDLTIRLGSATVAIRLDGSVFVNTSGPVNIKSSSLSIDSNNISIAANSLTVAGKQVATVGAVDSRGDTIVNKGW